MLKSLEKMGLEVVFEVLKAVILKRWIWWFQSRSVGTSLGTVTPRAASAKDPELDRVEEEEEGEEEKEREEEEEEKARRAKEDLNSLSDLDELLFCRSVNQVKVGNIWLFLTHPLFVHLRTIMVVKGHHTRLLNFIGSGNVERI